VVQDQMQLLIDLQEMDQSLRRLDVRKNHLEKEQSTLQSNMLRVEEMVTSLNGELEQLNQQRSELEQTLQQEEDNVVRAEGRLPGIQTQKEYVAVLKEVDIAKKLKKDTQDKISEINTQFNQLEKDRDEKQAELDELQSGNVSRQEDISGELSELATELEKGDKARSKMIGELPPRIQSRYQRLLQHRQGIAVVEARKSTCLGCNMQLPAQFFNQLLRGGEEFHFCPHCSRLLFIRPEEC